MHKTNDCNCMAIECIVFLWLWFWGTGARQALSQLASWLALFEPTLTRLLSAASSHAASWQSVVPSPGHSCDSLTLITIVD